MNRFNAWYSKNYSNITWFLIGFMTLDMLNGIGANQYTEALFSFSIIVLNFVFWRQRLQ